MGSTQQLIPAARTDALVIEEVPGEILIYDLKTHKAHCLNLTASLVWKHCDGKHTAGQVARMVEAELMSPISTDVVWLAVDQLEKRGLLQRPVKRAHATSRISRREAIRALGISAAVALPIVTSIIAPQPAQAASACIPAGAFGCTVDTDCCAPARCNTVNGQCFNP